MERCIGVTHQPLGFRADLDEGLSGIKKVCLLSFLLFDSDTVPCKMLKKHSTSSVVLVFWQKTVIYFIYLLAFYVSGNCSKGLLRNPQISETSL